MPTRERLRAGGVELHRHYAGSTACVPSRATLFTGQYPSLHGVSKTDGIAKPATDPAMSWLDPAAVPTMGDWFRAGGYRTHYRGKWHISHANIDIPGTHEGLMASDDNGVPIPAAVEAYRKADRLDPFGFSGWIGREPHGAAKSDCGTVRDGVYAEQVVEMFADLASARRGRAVAGGGVLRQPARHRVRRRSVRVAARLRTHRRHGARDPRGAVAGRLLRRSTGLSGAVQDGVARGDRRPAGRPRLPTAVLLPPQARGSGGRTDPRRPRRVGDGRRHHRRVHVRPRRHARSPRWHVAEVVQRVRRDHAGSAAGAPVPGSSRWRAASPRRRATST